MLLKQLQDEVYVGIFGGGGGFEGEFVRTCEVLVPAQQQGTAVDIVQLLLQASCFEDELLQLDELLVVAPFLP